MISYVILLILYTCKSRARGIYMSSQNNTHYKRNTFRGATLSFQFMYCSFCKASSICLCQILSIILQYQLAYVLQILVNRLILDISLNICSFDQQWTRSLNILKFLSSSFTSYFSNKQPKFSFFLVKRLLEELSKYQLRSNSC